MWNDFLAESRFVSCHWTFSYISYKELFSYLSGSVFVPGLWWSHLSTETCPPSQWEAYSSWFTAVSSSKTLEVHNFLKLFYLFEFLENILSCRNPLKNELKTNWNHSHGNRLFKIYRFLGLCSFFFLFPVEQHSLEFHTGKIFPWKL